MQFYVTVVHFWLFELSFLRVCVRACHVFAGLSAGTELLTVRYLSFAAPRPPSFDYICCNELVGAAAKWMPDAKYLIKPGRAGAEQIRSLQHTLDRRGGADDEVTGRLRFARDVIYEMPSNIPDSGACARVWLQNCSKMLRHTHIRVLDWLASELTVCPVRL